MGVKTLGSSNLVVSRHIRRENFSRLASSLGRSGEKNEGESQSLLAGLVQENDPLPVEVRRWLENDAYTCKLLTSLITCIRGRGIGIS